MGLRENSYLFLIPIPIFDTVGAFLKNSSENISLDKINLSAQNNVFAIAISFDPP